MIRSLTILCAIVTMCGITLWFNIKQTVFWDTVIQMDRQITKDWEVIKVTNYWWLETMYTGWEYKMYTGVSMLSSMSWYIYSGQAMIWNKIFPMQWTPHVYLMWFKNEMILFHNWTLHTYRYDKNSFIILDVVLE